MSKWGAKYAHKSEVFSSTPWWKNEAAEVISYIPDGLAFVADVGCNTGVLTQHIITARPEATVDAMDVNGYAIEVLKAKKLARVTATTNLDDLTEGLDVVILMHVVNQIEDLDQTMHTLWRKMRQGGKIIIVTHNPIPSKFKGLYNKIKGYKPDATMVWEPRKGELIQEMYEQGFKMKQCYYFGSALLPVLKRRLIYVGVKP